MDLLWYLILAHLTGDFALQSDRMAADKARSPRVLSAHVMVYVACVALAIWQYTLWSGALRAPRITVAAGLSVILALHWIQDYIKSRRFPDSHQAFYADQVLHLLQLYALRMIIV